ncbi:MAG: hypothetical protein Ct9H300mP19_20470 [Dehalococcoidia bacterium]|nr:MAG: hypothetical protein Ct9H300mP19_20470 [Dehalococcoidia bacterium]
MLLETNIDDSSGEVLGYVHQTLMDQGALDVWFTPIQMKKNRPGTMLSVFVGGFLVTGCRACAERDIYFWSTSTTYDVRS